MSYAISRPPTDLAAAPQQRIDTRDQTLGALGRLEGWPNRSA